MMQNGIALGTLINIIGGLVSWYTGMLLIEAAAHTGRVRYEEIAKVLYGKKFAVFTAAMNILALLGCNISYTVYVRYWKLSPPF
jgi:amino acid permease